MNTSQNDVSDPSEKKQSPSKISRGSGGTVINLLDKISCLDLDEELEHIYLSQGNTMVI